MVLGKLAIGLLSGMVAFVFSRYLIDALITGTTSSDVLWTAALPMAIAISMMGLTIGALGSITKSIRGGR